MESNHIFRLEVNRAMNLPNDLKDYRADSFQMIPPDLAIILLIVGAVIGYVLGAFGRIAS